jgi:hypothetical protein
MPIRLGRGKIRPVESTASMSSESTVQPDRTGIESDRGCASPTGVAAWRSTYAAALRVIDHHRAHLEARMTIQRLRRDENQAVDDTTSPALGG